MLKISGSNIYTDIYNEGPELLNIGNLGSFDLI